MTDPLDKLKKALRQEIRQEITKDADRLRYEAANAELLDAVEAGGGFADLLKDFLKKIEGNNVLELIRKADPENRAALMEVIGAFHRFGLSPQVAAKFKSNNDF